MRQLVDHFEKHGDPLNVDTLLPLAERKWVGGLHRVLPVTVDLDEGAAGAVTEGIFYPAFLKDLIRARESVLISRHLRPAQAPGAGLTRYARHSRVASGCALLRVRPASRVAAAARR